MIPKRVLLENFLSFGSPATEIAFGDDEPLWVVSGPNGVGKSALFDAMTYCLFGCHRGGKGQGIEELIRHGQESFRVEFDFEFNGVDYRIVRRYKRAGRPTQRVEAKPRDGNAWQAVPGLNSPADVKAWAERTLGLGFEAFAASVLLRQGQADEIITATGTRRLEILKKIIAAERYEALSVRVHDAWRMHRLRLDDLCKRRDGTIPVGELEWAAAREAEASFEAARSGARGQAATAAERVPYARQWAALDLKRRNLESLILTARARSSAAERIRRDHSRLVELSEAAPKLRQYVSVRDRSNAAELAMTEEGDEVARLERERGRLEEAHEDARGRAEAHGAASDCHRRRAVQLREEIERDARFVAAAAQIAALRLRLEREFPYGLDESLAAAKVQAQGTAIHATQAGHERAEITGLLKHARARLKEVAALGADVTCSQCGQFVTAEHAEAERGRLAAAAAALAERERAAEVARKTAERERAEAESERERLETLARDRQATAASLADKQRTLRELGVSADPDDLRRQLDGKRAEVECEAAAAERAALARAGAGKEVVRLDAERNIRSTELDKAQVKVRQAERDLATERGQLTAIRATVPPFWQARLDGLNAADVQALDAEREGLAVGGAAEQFKQLEQDEARRDEWTRHGAEVAEQIEALPEAARVPPAAAEREAATAARAAAEAERAWESARATCADLTRRAEEMRLLIAEIAAAERATALHGKLDDLLGKNGLQRELVRSAEREIVRCANDTVRNLSDGDLTIDLDDTPEGGHEAFALRVRRADEPTPIGVNYLSGSQKFRVAVSVALAIGRFAAGQTRPLECVIVDEGFGSLDRDGLRAAADELNRLRGHLRRIILVSHQEEFADRFPVVLRLSPGENGTIAEAVRR